MNQLGRMSNLHFINLNQEVQPFELPYSSQIVKIEEAERMIQ